MSSNDSNSGIGSRLFMSSITFALLVIHITCADNKGQITRLVDEENSQRATRFGLTIGRIDILSPLTTTFSNVPKMWTAIEDLFYFLWRDMMLTIKLLNYFVKPYKIFDLHGD